MSRRTHRVTSRETSLWVRRTALTSQKLKGDCHTMCQMGLSSFVKGMSFLLMKMLPPVLETPKSSVKIRPGVRHISLPVLEQDSISMSSRIWGHFTQTAP